MNTIPTAASRDECVVQGIRVELIERGRERGDCVPVAACSIATVASASSPICKLHYELLHPETAHGAIGGGYDKQSRKLCDSAPNRFTQDTVEKTSRAGLIINEGGAGTVFRRYKPFPGRAVVSQGAESDG